MSDAGEITRLLAAARRGDAVAEEDLIALVYRDLQMLARHQMRGERSDHTLQPTALVHETYLRLLKTNGEVKDRAHFFATAATVMRRILIDHARQKAAAKRPGAHQRAALNESDFASHPAYETLLLVDEALARLGEWNERQARVVELIYFGGLSEEEAGLVLDISPRTVRRDWRAARAWLQGQLSQTQK